MELIKNKEMPKDAPIGVFDSGVGGLTVAREIMRQIPNEKSYISAILPEFLMEANRRKRLQNMQGRLSASCRGKM